MANQSRPHQSPPQPWQKLETEAGPNLRILQARYDLLKNPRNQHELRALVLDTVDWVNVVAVTPDKKIVVVRQYRFGTEQISTEIPGGAIDRGEESRQAAIRELREETGYTSEKWRYLGSVQPNPAFLSNVCHQWYAEDAEQTAQLSLDAGEDIVVDLLTIEEIGAEIQAGTFRHSLAMLALAHIFDLRAVL